MPSNGRIYRMSEPDKKQGSSNDRVVIHQRTNLVEPPWPYRNQVPNPALYQAKSQVQN